MFMGKIRNMKKGGQKFEEFKHLFHPDDSSHGCYSNHPVSYSSQDLRAKDNK